ncbi:FxSxx-COOH system tetratricopeptide repeat protein (plasmid) [Streptomyces sp. PCS3-D2]|uniref:FxSxx-COOH system tetratricopeptide repeat protein n=1 Tax=Streptomyces sp. PCS3-D2 TaxID=1460244 RepID=UPI00272B088B|nr:FxSxx-COOH system tetratricopeptide repeat protein [Streptomyces sp. PCS3-D2]WKV76528.1 FxSxx-COOH system tetratricopeptide repeat protein [Streptomyces sp. PCS3-D2]
MHQRGPQEPASWPHQVGAVPPRVQSFQHRAEADRLSTAVQSGGTAALCQVLAGMGGVGKTQLAADYAHTAWRDDTVDVLVWVSAATRSAVVTQYAQAGVELCRGDPHDPDRAAVSFLAWLAPKPGAALCRWLVVLDDVAEPADLRGLWPPASPLGRVLVTTRRRDAALTGVGRRLMEVGLFTPAEAVAYLSEALAVHDRAEPDDQLATLAADLGHLPLALSQATAYLVDAGVTIPAYRALLADRATALADAAPDTLPDDQNHTTAAALTLSLDRADALRPCGLARPMLQLAAFLDPNGIPQTVLTSAPALTHLTACRTPTAGGTPKPAPVTEAEATAALRALHRLHLIEHTPDTPRQAVRVHQLTQRAVRDTLTPDQRDTLARTTAASLVSVWPEVERDTDLAQTLRANTTALTSHSEEALYQPDVHAVLDRDGRSLGESGQATAACGHFQHVVAESQRHLGPDHPGTLSTRHHLARWRGEAGDAAGAVTAFADLLTDQLRVLGPDHPHTLTTRHNLARWRGQAGDAAGAVTAFADLLTDQLRVLGPDHPDTLMTRHNLARWRGEAGDAAGAVTAFADLLTDRLRVLGPDHPGTLTTRHNLARWRGRAGDVTGAATALADLLTDQLRVLGPDHPHTLTTRHNLAYWRGWAGDAAGAASGFADLLTDRLRVLGPDHPGTLSNRHNLARWRGEAGDATGAATALADLLTDRLRVLGPDHPGTLNTRHHLARWRGEAGDATGAVTAFADLLTDQLRVLGPDHPHTLTTRHNLAYWRHRADRRDPDVG